MHVCSLCVLSDHICSHLRFGCKAVYHAVVLLSHLLLVKDERRGFSLMRAVGHEILCFLSVTPCGLGISIDNQQLKLFFIFSFN